MRILSKKETKEAELNTIPILNFTTNLYQGSKIEKDNLLNLILSSHNWCYQKKIKTTKDRKKYLIKKIGNPNYHATYEYREAVWGFEYKAVLIILYYSTKGFSIQISPNTSIILASEILTTILNKINLED